MLRGLPASPVVFHDVKHQIEIDHVRAKLAALLKSAQSLSFSCKSLGSKVAIFEATTSLGKEAIAIQLGHDGRSGESSGGITLQHRLNGRVIFKIIDLTIEGGNRYLPPPVSLKGRNQIKYFVPMLCGWTHLAHHAIGKNGDGALSEDLRDQAFALRQKQQDIRDLIVHYIAAAATNSNLSSRIAASASWPTGEGTGWVKIRGADLDVRPAMDAADEIMRHFKNDLGGTWKLHFENSGTGMLRITPIQDHIRQICPLGIVETMKAMRDPRMAGLSFQLGE